MENTLFDPPDYTGGWRGASDATPDDGGDDDQQERPDAASAPFDANLADLVSEDTMGAIAAELIGGIEADIESRQEWWAAYNSGRDLLGIKSEDRTWPFQYACGAYHPILAEAVIRFQSNARGEMLPAAGPVKTQIVGDVSPQIEAAADRVGNYMNYYLTELDVDYYPEMDKLLFLLPLCGSVFKKTFMDPIKERPVSPLIHPQDLIVSYNSSSIENSGRVTHVVRYLKSEMIRLQLSGFYRDVELPDPQEDIDAVATHTDDLEGRHNTNVEGDDRHVVYECHTDLDIEEPGLEHVGPDGTPTGLPLPYIVTIERESKKILGIRRNWLPADKKFQKVQWFTHWGFIPGQGLYHYGYIHLLGGACKVITNIMRQLHDTGMLNSFPAGFRVKGGAKFEQNMQPLGPTEWREIDTNGMPIGDAVMPMPYKEPSAVLVTLMEALIDAVKSLSTTTELPVGDGQEEMPVGTTIALIERATKVESAILKRLHVVHKTELRAYKKLFEAEPQAPYPYVVNGQSGVAMGQDFAMTDVIPTSDPNIPSQAHRLSLATFLLQSALQAPPGTHDVVATYQNLYKTAGMPDNIIQQVLPPKPVAMPLDPVSENMNALLGKPLATNPEQDQLAHITSHMTFMQSPATQANPNCASALQSHIAEHTGLFYRSQIELALGHPLPPAGQPLPPDVERQIAMAVAAVSNQVAQTMAQLAGGPQAQTMLQAQANQLKAQEIHQREMDGQRKTAQQAQQDAMETRRSFQESADQAAERTNRLQLADKKIEAEHVRNQGQIHVAALTGQPANPMPAPGGAEPGGPPSGPPGI